jgi:hypothetical protein
MDAARLLRAVRNWRDLAFEYGMHMRPAGQPAVPPTWPVDPEQARGVAIRWPESYRCPEAGKWVNALRDGLKKTVPMKREPVPQSSDGVVVFQLIRGKKAYDIAVDYWDYADRIDEGILARTACYFKMQYARTGYGSNRVIPGGYVAASRAVYHYLPYLRAVRESGIAAYDVYGRFGTRFAIQVRESAVQRLTNQDEFRYEGGLRMVRYSRYLRQVARAKICIDLPGNGDFCYRLVDYLAIGSCVIGPRHGTSFPVPLVDREHVVYTKDDLSDLVPLCKHYLDHPGERERIARNAREYFDRYLHSRQLADYYLNESLQRTA